MQAWRDFLANNEDIRALLRDPDAAVRRGDEFLGLHEISDDIFSDFRSALAFTGAVETSLQIERDPGGFRVVEGEDAVSRFLTDANLAFPLGSSPDTSPRYVGWLQKVDRHIEISREFVHDELTADLQAIVMGPALDDIRARLAAANQPRPYELLVINQEDSTWRPPEGSLSLAAVYRHRHELALSEQGRALLRKTAEGTALMAERPGVLPGAELLSVLRPSDPVLLIRAVPASLIKAYAAATVLLVHEHVHLQTDLGIPYLDAAGALVEGGADYLSGADAYPRSREFFDELAVLAGKRNVLALLEENLGLPHDMHRAVAREYGLRTYFEVLVQPGSNAPSNFLCSDDVVLAQVVREASLVDPDGLRDRMNANPPAGSGQRRAHATTVLNPQLFSSGGELLRARSIVERGWVGRELADGGNGSGMDPSAPHTKTQRQPGGHAGRGNAGGLGRGQPGADSPAMPRGGNGPAGDPTRRAGPRSGP